MNKLLVGTAAFVAFATIGSASAADLPVKAPPMVAPPVWSWTGFYVGANVGGHWGDDELTTTTSPPNFVAGFATALDAASAATVKPQGLIGGVQAGYNWQFNSFLMGVEADANGLSGTGSRSVTFGPLGGAGAGTFMNDSVQETFLATVRGRVGVTFDRALLYATGGYAVGTIKTSDNLGFPGNFNDATSASTTRSGWTAGAGVEYAFAPNWSAKVEYLFVDLGTTNVALACGVAPCVNPNDSIVHHRYTDDILRVGVNYHFGGPVVARY